MTKRYLTENVLYAAEKRIDYLFSRFDREELFLSFSAGKDSTVLLHLALDAARRHNKLPLKVMTIDLEASYKGTIDLLETMMLRDEVEPYWICLPFGYRNSVSMFQPYWVCWNKQEEDRWIRPMPSHSCVINEENNPFAEYGWFYGMRPSQFYKVFARYIARKTGTAVSMVGIRSDESLNRWRVLYANKVRIEDKNWTTQIGVGDEEDDGSEDRGLWR